MTSTPADDAQEYSSGYKAWVLFLIFLMMASNYIDRTIVRILAQPIKKEFGLTDLQVGLLGGFAFAVLYMVMGVPIARLAERKSRVAIISTALAVWSVMTALCGVATSYIQLLAFRIGVGVGEAGGMPPSQSLISDYFPPHQRASAISINSFGIAMGGLGGSVIGGFAAEAWGWRAALMVVGIPGLLLALLFWLTVKEPKRGRTDAPVAAAEGALPPPSLLAVAKRLFRNATFLNLAAGATIANFAIQGIHQFDASYFVRRFDIGLGQVGLIMGLVGGISQGIGMVGGGLATDWTSRGDRRWYVWLPAIGIVLAAPVYALAFMQTTWFMSAALLIVPGLLLYLWHAPVQAVIQNICPANMRATAIALYVMCTASIGLGLGPVGVGYAADKLAQVAFSRESEGVFNTLCPGGGAPDGSPAALASACHDASATGVQWAMIAVTVLFLWSTAHFLIAARTIRRDMKATIGD